MAQGLPVTPTTQRALIYNQFRGLKGLGFRARGSTYTTIRELGPIIPSIVWYFGAYFPNIYIYIYMDPLGTYSFMSYKSYIRGNY